MKVIASWDDGSIYDLKMAELMQKYSIPTTFFVPTYILQNKTKDFLAESDIKQLSNNFVIGSHSSNHKPLKKMTIAQLAYEIKGSKNHLEQTIGKEVSSFSYPKDSLCALAKSLIKGAGYNYARTSIPGWLDPGEDLFEMKCTVQIGIDRIEYRNISWEKFAQNMLTKCKDESIFHIFGNSQDIEKFQDWDNLESLLKDCV